MLIFSLIKLFSISYLCMIAVNKLLQLLWPSWVRREGKVGGGGEEGFRERRVRSSFNTVMNRWNLKLWLETKKTLFNIFLGGALPERLIIFFNVKKFKVLANSHSHTILYYNVIWLRFTTFFLSQKQLKSSWNQFMQIVYLLPGLSSWIYIHLHAHGDLESKSTELFL